LENAASSKMQGWKMQDCMKNAVPKFHRPFSCAKRRSEIQTGSSFAEPLRQNQQFTRKQTIDPPITAQRESEKLSN